MTLAQARADLLAVLAEHRRCTEARFTDNGVAMIGDEIIYDGEAEALGVKPLTRWPAATWRGTAAPATEAVPTGRREGQGPVRPPVGRRGRAVG